MKKLKEIIEELKEIRTETKTKVSDEILFENAVKLFISKKISEDRKESKLDNELPNSKQPATKKQLWRLKQLKIEIPKDITKFEASKLIDKYK